MSERVIRVGAIGLGRAFSLMAPTFVADPRVKIVAGADPRPEACAQFASEFGGAAYSAAEDLAADPHVDAVYISTPHQFHAANAIAAAAAGKHAIVEKPMALTLNDCRRMVEAAERAGVALIVGHSHSFDAPILHARMLVASGALGRLRIITAVNFTDFLYRPRRAEELDTEQGGGVIFNQAPHQVDVIRLLGGGRVRSVRAMAGAWDAARPTEGAYSALLGFEDGAFASLTYSGFAHYDSDELMGWRGESGMRKDPAGYGAARAALAASSIGAETQVKAAQNYGGPRYRPPLAAGTDRAHQHFGFVVASCDHGDLRPMPHGVAVFGDTERRFDTLPVPPIPRREVVDELYGAVVNNVAPLHSGAWGLATMEVCLALLQSHREGREIIMSEQVAAP
jgi:phthalate 4,5-cis-dihydrodiol dehydrogenase